MELSLILFLFALAKPYRAAQSDPYNQYGSILPIGAKPSYHDDNESLNKCVPIEHPVCTTMQYNLTKVPTWLGLSSQADATRRISDYDPLKTVNCSNYLSMFLCTIYFPMCTQATKEPTAVPPCQELCLHVKDRCERYMKKVQFSWPVDLSCDKFPKSPALCVKPKDFSDDAPKELDKKLEALLFPDDDQENYSCSAAEMKVSRENTTSTDANLVIPVTTANKQLNCLSNCEANIFYRLSDKRFAHHWQFIWALICFFSSLLTVIAFLNNRKRFNYPERPIIYLSMCYLFYSVGYLLRSMIGYELTACHPLYGKDPVTSEERRFLIRPGYETPMCTATFLILSYSKLASSIWWIILGVSWYLSTSRTWSPEGVESISSIFHMLAWSLPAIKVILALILHKIDANELTGLCSVGNTNANSFMFFEILPMSLCLGIGLVFMLIGFVSVFRVRRDLKNPLIQRLDAENNNRRRLEKLIAKLSVFTVLYTIPSVSLLIGQIYELTQMNNWTLALRHLNYQNPDCINPYGIKWSDSKCHPRFSPIPEIGMLKIFASLVIGITSGIWIWANKKTVTDIHRCCCGGKGGKKKDPFTKTNPTLFRGHPQEPMSSLSSGPTFTQLTTNGTSTRYTSNNTQPDNNNNSYYAYDVSGVNNDPKKFASCV